MIKYKVVYACIIYLLHYIFAYIKHNADVSLENYSSKIDFKMSGDKKKTVALKES